MLHIHGTSDETISYANADFNFNGIAVQVGLGAEALVETWRNYNQCSTEPIVYNFEDTKNDGLTFEQYTYKNEETGNKTVFIKVNGGVHTWYDADRNDIDYTTEIYKFFTGQENVPTSIESNVAENFSIYPNPAANIVNVITDRNAELSIFNVTGKEVKHISANENTTSIDISELPNGLYFIVANGIAQKLTIER